MDIRGLNLYAYCNNNPVMYLDGDGHSAVLCILLGIGLGVLAGGISSGVTSYMSGNRGNALWGDIFGGALIGGALGAAGIVGGLFGAGIIGAGTAAIRLGITTVASFGAGVGSYFLEKTWGRGIPWNSKDALLDGVITAGESVISFTLGAAFAASGAWSSLDQGEFSSYYSYFRTGLSRTQSALGSSIMYLNQNAGQIALRTGLKTAFTFPWVLIRRYLNE